MLGCKLIGLQVFVVMNMYFSSTHEPDEGILPTLKTTFQVVIILEIILLQVLLKSQCFNVYLFTISE